MVAEWLRRWTRNPMGFPRVGSNPARDVNIVIEQIVLFSLHGLRVNKRESLFL